VTQQKCVTGCGRPTRDVRLLCDQHVWELEQALAEIPALLDELKVTLTRQDKLGHGEGGNKPTKASEQPLPFNVHASANLGDLRIYLVGWVRDLYETSSLAGPACLNCHHGTCQAIRWHVLPPDTLRGMSRWLLARLDVLAKHPAAEDIHSEICGIALHPTGSAWRAVDRAATKTRFVVGPCPELDGAVNCLGEVWAYIPTREEERAVMVCAECGTTWESQQWMRAGKRILDEKNRRVAVDRQLRAIFGEAS